MSDCDQLKGAIIIAIIIGVIIYFSTYCGQTIERFNGRKIYPPSRRRRGTPSRDEMIENAIYDTRRISTTASNRVHFLANRGFYPIGDNRPV